MTQSGFDIPSDMRRAAEQSVEQARRAFESFISMAHQTAATWNEQSAAAREGMMGMSQKAMEFATQNVAASLDFAQRIVAARDVSEIVRIQSDFIQSQMRTYGEQAKTLGETAAKASSRGDKDKA